MAEIATPKGFVFIFVCTGNTCRSPMCEQEARRWLAKNRPSAGDRVYSRGLGKRAVEAGSDGPCPQAIKAAAEQGLDVSKHRANVLSSADVAEATVIFGVTSGHLCKVKALPCFKDAKVELCTLGEDMQDPYMASLEVYRRTAAQISKQVPLALAKWFSSSLSLQFKM